MSVSGYIRFDTEGMDELVAHGLRDEDGDYGPVSPREHERLAHPDRERANGARWLPAS